MKFIVKNGIIFVGLIFTATLLYKYYYKKPLDGDDNPFFVILFAFVTLIVCLLLVFFKQKVSDWEK